MSIVFNKNDVIMIYIGHDVNSIMSHENKNKNN